jgi:hypothetical protein
MIQWQHIRKILHKKNKGKAVWAKGTLSMCSLGEKEFSVPRHRQEAGEAETSYIKKS